MSLTMKQKAYMLNRLFSVFNDSRSHRDTCLSAIAICMLTNVHTVEELTASSNSHQNPEKSSVQVDLDYASEQQP